MTDLVDPTEIEAIVGVQRHATEHWGRNVSAEARTYILHSKACLDTLPDLRDCDFSVVLDDWGINPDEWPMDRPVRLAIEDNRLAPDYREDPQA